MPDLLAELDAVYGVKTAAGLGDLMRAGRGLAPVARRLVPAVGLAGGAVAAGSGGPAGPPPASKATPVPGQTSRSGAPDVRSFVDSLLGRSFPLGGVADTAPLEPRGEFAYRPGSPPAVGLDREADLRTQAYLAAKDPSFARYEEAARAGRVTSDLHADTVRMRLTRDGLPDARSGGPDGTPVARDLLAATQPVSARYDTTPAGRSYGNAHAWAITRPDLRQPPTFFGPRSRPAAPAYGVALGNDPGLGVPESSLYHELNHVRQFPRTVGEARQEWNTRHDPDTRQYPEFVPSLADLAWSAEYRRRQLADLGRPPEVPASLPTVPLSGGLRVHPEAVREWFGSRGLFQGRSAASLLDSDDGRRLIDRLTDRAGDPEGRLAALGGLYAAPVDLAPTTPPAPGAVPYPGGVSAAPPAGPAGGVSDRYGGWDDRPLPGETPAR